MPIDKGWLLKIFSFGNERLVKFVQVPTNELWELPFKTKSMKPTWKVSFLELNWVFNNCSLLNCILKVFGWNGYPQVLGLTDGVAPCKWFDLTMIRKFWCGNSSPQFFVLTKRPRPFSDEGCSVGVLFIHGFGEDGLQNQIWPTVITPSNKDKQTGAMCWCSNHMLHVFGGSLQVGGWQGSAPQT